MGSLKYGVTRKNIPQYHTLSRPKRYTSQHQQKWGVEVPVIHIHFSGATSCPWLSVHEFPIKENKAGGYNKFCITDNIYMEYHDCKTKLH